MRASVLFVSLWMFCAVTVLATPVDVGLDATADYYGLIDPTTFFTSARARLTIVPELSFRSASRMFETRLSALLYLQGFDEPALVSPERMIREAYVGLHVGLFDLFLGQRFVRWGMVDVMSPLNNVNHSDTTVLSMDDPHEGTLPDLMLQIQFFPSDLWYVDAVYVPFLQPDVLGIEDTLVQDQLQIDLPDGTSHIYDVDAAFLNRSVEPFSDWAHSLHLSAHLNSFWVDLAGVYSFYIDQSPDFGLSDIRESIVVDGSVTTHTITGSAYPAYNRAHSIGLAAAFYLGDFLISADAALKITENFDGTRIDVKNSEVFSVLQAERLFWQNRLRAQAIIFHRYLLHYDAMPDSDYSPVVEAYISAIVAEYLLQEPQSQLYALLGGDVKFLRERLSVSANAIYGLDEEVLFVMPRLSLKLTDYVSLQLGSDLWFGQEGKGLLGAGLHNDNIFLRARLEI